MYIMYCDECKKEIKDGYSSRYYLKDVHGTIIVELQTGFHFCFDCIRKVVHRDFCEQEVQRV